MCDLCSDEQADINHIRALTFANAGMSATMYLGFPMLSTKIAFVFSSIAAAKSSGFVVVTNLTPIPNFFRKTIRQLSAMFQFPATAYTHL